MENSSRLLNQEGQKYRGFILTRIVRISELQCTLKELTHERTGAQVMHLENEDPENLFCLSFRTIPTTSNGVAHILEHTVLCGSERFPIKDPFFSMTRRSLNTFMNALTGPDFTCYPAASQVKKDFYNLLDVYLDSVFHPLLKELSFLQEGWRLEFTDPDDANTPLHYKGIVYNEMKGSLSSPSTRLVEVLNAALFPNLTYGINSGGDPKIIPELTHDKLKQFHEEFYHPSRCLFFFYGNLPLEPHLDFIAEKVLDKAEKKLPIPSIPLQPRFSEPVYQKVGYPISAEEDTKNKTIIAFSWLTCSLLEQHELLALSILETTLMATDASPLKIALLRSGLCTQASAYTEGELSEVPFVITLKGCNPENADRLEEILKKTLQSIYKEGIPLDLIENSIHQIEFHRSEITGDGSPFGLALFMRSALFKQHGGDPVFGLMIHSLFEKLRETMKARPRYFEELIKKYLLENRHFVRLILYPSKELSHEELASEQHILHTIQEQLNPEQKNELVEQAKKLAEFQRQQEKENIDVLPKVTLKDVSKDSQVFPLHREKQANVEIYQHSCFTNEIVYADLVFPLPYIAKSDLYLVNLFSILLSQLGCGGRNYAQNLEYIQGNTGGVGASLNWNYQASNSSQFHPALHIQGKALYRKADKLFILLKQICESVDFSDKERLKELVLKHYTGLESSINRHAMRYAINQSAKGLSAGATVASEWYGLEYLMKVRGLTHDIDQRLESLVSKLQEFHGKLLHGEQADLVLTCDETMYQKCRQEGFYGLAHLKKRPYQAWKADYSFSKEPSQGRVISSPVAFTAQVFPTLSYNHPDAPSLHLAASLFDNVVLHNRIRERGGAYGGGAVSSVLSGAFYFYAYRDPHISSTVTAFQDSIKTIADKKFDAQDLEEAKLEIIQSMDSPVAPGSRGDLSYGWLKEGRNREAFRKRLLELTIDEVQHAVQTHIVPNFAKGSLVTFASRALIEKENKLLTAQGIEPLAILELY